MPLYKIKEVNFNNIPLIDQSHLRVMWAKLVQNATVYHVEQMISPRIYVGTEAFSIINQSTSFSFRDINSGPIDYVGHFMGWNVFISDDLVDDEYVLGVDENEIKICKRKYKLKKIVEKMTKYE